MESPVGLLIMESCDNGLHQLSLEKESPVESFHPVKVDGSVRVRGTKCLNGPSKDAVEWLKEYFGDAKKSSLPLPPDICFLKGGEEEKGFRVRCWETLLKSVGMGETVSYGELAGRCGCERAARAVGSAMKTNPISIIIPCHRVIRSDGKLGNYGHGCAMKQWLIDREKEKQL